MSGHRYQPVHDQDDGGSIYPPTSRIADSELAHGPPFPLKRSSHWPSKMTIGKWAVVSVAALVIFYYAILGAFSRRPGTISSQLFDQTYRNASLQPTYGDGNSSSPGAFYRDAYPIKTMLAFWSIAEQEVADKKLDTCGDQMGSGLIEAYHRSLLKFCGQGSEDVPQLSALQTTQETTEVPDSGIWCAPVHHDDFSKWWPYPAAPCLSTNIRATEHDGKLFKTVGCDVTAHGEELVAEMGREQFLGNNIEKTEQRECKEVVKRTLVVIGRQDQWNPFHVAEDLITTMVSIFIMARSAPDLINTRVQLVFSEGYGMDANHFTALWDRIGAWAPRRLSLDPWGDDVCLSNTIHSVGAGASLLSATGISRSYSCASTITWAASHYYRHLFGLPKMASKNPRRPLNVLWLSRSKLDIYAQDHNDWSSWRDVRHINNEKQLTDRLARGLREACEGDSLGRRCVFQDARDEPEVWTSQGFDESTDSFPVRFASIDPTVHALETQINYVGQSSILISSHGGALGLSLFLPPGLATVIELQVEAVKGNFHFQHMAAQTGQNYEVVEISRDVDVEQVWGALQRWVWRMAQL